MRKQATFLPLMLSSCLAFAQADSTIYQQAVYFSTNIDTKAQEIDEPIYNGIEHISYHSSIKGFAYYGSPDWLKGSITYRNVCYKDVYLKYDLVRDEVIVRHVNGTIGVTLFTPRVHSFSLQDSRFVYLNGNEKLSVQPGIFEELRQGKISLYAKRSKSIREMLTVSGVEKEFESKNLYFVLKDGVLYPVKKQKDILELVGDKKNQINAALRDREISFNSDPETALKFIADYYNESIR